MSATWPNTLISQVHFSLAGILRERERERERGREAEREREKENDLTFLWYYNGVLVFVSAPKCISEKVLLINYTCNYVL